MADYRDEGKARTPAVRTKRWFARDSDRDIADGVTRGRAMRGHELRQDLLVKTEAIPGGPVAGFSGRRWKDAEPECGEVQP